MMKKRDEKALPEDMHMDEALVWARKRLENVTPLKRDCGRICGAACCRAPQEEETGMLLFPGEEEAYSGRPEWTIQETAMGPMVICSGTCDRGERPLACRMFPLLPALRDGTVTAVTDLRAKSVCPLARQGRSALDPAFRDAVREAGEQLLREERQAAFLRKLTAEQEEIRRLRRAMGGEGHV